MAFDIVFSIIAVGLQLAAFGWALAGFRTVRGGLKLALLAIVAVFVAESILHLADALAAPPAGEGHALRCALLVATGALMLAAVIALERLIGRYERTQRALERANAESGRHRTRLQQIVDLVPSWIFVHDRDGRFLFANKAQAEAYGATPEELIGKTDADFHDRPEEVARWLDDHCAVIDTGTPAIIDEEPFTPKAGATRWFETHLVPFETADDAGPAILGLSADITERKALAARMRAQEFYLSDLVSRTETGRLVLDGEGRILEANAAFLDALGVAAQDDIRGRPVFEWVAPEFLAQCRETFSRCLREGFVRNAEAELVRRDGTRIAVQVDASAETREGRLRIHALCRDVSDLKRAQKEREASERRYREIFDESPVAILEEDWSAVKVEVDRLQAAGIDDIAAHLRGDPRALKALFDRAPIVSASRAALEVYRAREFSDLAALDKSDVCHPDDLVNFADALGAFAQGSMRYDSEIRDFATGGEEIALRWRAVIPPAHARDWSRVLCSVEDVGRRAEAESALVERERHYRELFEESPFAILEEDWSAVKAGIDALAREGVMDLAAYLAQHPETAEQWYRRAQAVNVSNAALALYRCPSKAEFNVFYYDRDAQSPMVRSFADCVVALNEGAQGFEAESSDRYADGTEIALHWRAVVPRAHAEDWRRVLVSLVDIGARKRSEDALRQSEAWLQDILDNMTDGLVVIDENSIVRSINAAAAGLFGYAAESVTGRLRIQRLIPVFSRNWMEMVSDAEPRRRFNAEGWRRDGTALPIEIALARATIGGARVGIVSVRDVGERKKLEAALNNYFTLSADLFCVAGFDGYFKTLSPNWSDVLGYSVNELQARPFIDFVHPDDVAATRAEAEKLAKGGRTSQFRNRYRAKDGRTRWLEWNATGLWEDGLIYATARDVSEQLAVQEMLQQAQKMEAVGRLTGGIAHDFNNLLTVILGNLELLEGRCAGDPAAAGFVANAAKAGIRGAELVRRLLAFSRRQPLNPRPLDVNALIGHLLGLARPTLGVHVRIETDLGSDLPPVLADEGQLESALMNILLNARDALPEDGGSIRIQTAPPADGGEKRFARIVVRDNGHGMPEEVLERIFDPFFTTKERGKGTGLGLSMVFGFVQQSHGTITVDSSPGGGTVVEIGLPLAGERAVPAPPAPAETAGAPAGTGSLLVVEDDPDIRHFVIATLEAAGYRCVGAETGAEALDCLEAKGPFDMLLTDIVLPGGMNGLEVSKAVRRRQPAIKVLYSSGYSEQWVAGAEELREGVAYLPKPYRREALTRKVREVLGRPGA